MNPENKNYGQERQKPAEYGEQAKDYPFHLKKIHDEMERDLKFNPEAFGYGPVFHLKTSKDMEVQVKTFHFDKQNSSIRPVPGDYQKYRRSHLVATDAQGVILGNRMMRTYYYGADHPGSRIETSGEITTRYRGLGLSAAIDLANRELLQDEVDHIGGTLRWGIINGNRMDLSKLKKPKPKVPGLVEVPAEFAPTDSYIREKEAEQDRWQNLYGPMGKLGAYSSTSPDEDDFEIILVARRIPQNLDRASDVWLERNLDEAVEEPKIKNLMLEKEGGVQAARADKLEEFKRLSKQMREILENAG